MSDANIPALLEELWEVDFETWKDIRFLLSNSMMFSEPREIPLEQHIYHDIIQGCIQRACSARGWFIHLWLGIELNQVEIWYTPDRKEHYHMLEASTPAAAILAAYIEAKRAMR